MSAQPRPCLCDCGRQLRRERSLPLCRAASARAYELVKLFPLPTNLSLADPRLARSNYFFCDAKTVAAALRGDLAEAARRMAYREQHGLGADPDRIVVAVAP